MPDRTERTARQAVTVPRRPSRRRCAGNEPVDSATGSRIGVDELLTRLVEGRREAVLAGVGLRADTDAAERAREARERMKRGVGAR